jgi:hypothetical protein
MEEEQLNELIRQTLRDSRPVPDPPLDEMWARIERRAFGNVAPSYSLSDRHRREPHGHAPAWRITTLAAAAALVAGVALGWYAAPRATAVTSTAMQATTHAVTRVAENGSTPIAGSAAQNEAGVTTGITTGVTTQDGEVPAATLASGVGTPRQYPSAPSDPRLHTASMNNMSNTTSTASELDDIGNGAGMGRYLVQTAALLASLPSDRAATESDTTIARRAGDLLIQTHLLLDSQAGSDPTLHRLLEDLELVLAQVARLRGPQSRSDLQLIHQAITAHDVLPRVHDATVEVSTTD